MSSRPPPPPALPIPPPPPLQSLTIPSPTTQLSPSLISTHHHDHNNNLTSSRLVPPLTGTTVSVSLLILFIILYRKLFRRREESCPSSSVVNVPRRFSYSTLRRATSSFSASRRLGQGGFGAVYSGVINLPKKKKVDVAVKLMDSGSLQGEREFHNEILMANKLVYTDRVVRLLGFASDRKKRRMCLVYELMKRGNLQDCLLRKNSKELMCWDKRFQIALEVATALAYLHHHCEPPVIHGDIKPSNILLNDDFSAKIGDFGLARLKLVDHSDLAINLYQYDLGNGIDIGKKRDETESNGGDNGSMVETESVTTVGFEDMSLGVDQSPENFIRVPAAETSPDVEMVSAAASPPEFLGKDRDLEAQSVKCDNSVENEKETAKDVKVKGKDSWRKQDDAVSDSGNGKVKDYVMQWLGSEVKKEGPGSNWIGGSSSRTIAPGKMDDKKKSKKTLEWWVSMEDGKESKKETRRPVRKWWKEEYHEKLARKKKDKKEKNHQAKTTNDDEDDWWPRDDEMYVDQKKKGRSKSRKSSHSSIDWWLDGLSGDLRKVRHTSYDSISGEIPKSGGMSSTPSMRGTVCYIAPEYGGGGDLSEKCDVYSYGVLLLVLIAGRRPLHVSGSPMAEYQRANLLSWSRKLARQGKLLDLVDKRIQSLNKEQALLCIKVALICLQKFPVQRPSMKEVEGMLSGELVPPQLPTELSPSPPGRFRFKSQKKPR